MHAADAMSHHPVSCDFLATISYADRALSRHVLLAVVQQDICLQWFAIARETCPILLYVDYCSKSNQDFLRTSPDLLK